MSFLRNHLQERETCSNLEMTQDEEEEENDHEGVKDSESTRSSEMLRPLEEDSVPHSSDMSTTSVKSNKKQAPRKEYEDELSKTLTEFTIIKKQSASPFSTTKRSMINFFETILKFPEMEQSEVKRDIANLVHSKYITILRKKEPTSHENFCTPTYTFQPQQPYSGDIAEIALYRDL